MAMSAVSLALRFGRHFAYRPADLAYLPAFMAINTFLLDSLRVAGFFRMGHGQGGEPASAGTPGPACAIPLALVPYLLGAILIGGAVALSLSGGGR